MKFEERPYAGKTFRPRPEVHLDPAARLLIVATSWGARSGARKVIDRMTEFLNLAREDRETTSPFQKLTCLTPQANNLRTAVMLANESLFREDNRAEYRTGVELFAAIIDENECNWVQVGNPQVLLSRADRSLLPLGSQLDLSSDMSTSNALLPPLPSQLLGLDSTIQLSINSFRLQADDRLVLLSHSHLPKGLFSTAPHDANLEQISRTLAVAHPDLAFWLGILSMPTGSSAHQENHE